MSQAERGGTPLSHRQKLLGEVADSLRSKPGLWLVRNVRNRKRRQLPTHNTQNRKVDDEMDHDISKNKSQMKYSGKLMRHWYWCIFLTLMLLVLTAVVLYINTLAGVIVGGFTVMVYLTILGLDVYYRPKVLAELLDFSRKYSEIERDMLKEFVVPYSLVQADGKILRMNDAMCQLTGKSDSYHGNISAVFSQLNSAHFPLDSEEREVEIEHAGRRYRVCMKRIPFEELIDDSAVVERISGSCFAVALCLFDITELSEYKKETYEQNR